MINIEGNTVIKWLKKGTREDVEAQYGIGTCFVDGDGVTQDYAEATQWLCKAATRGDK